MDNSEVLCMVMILLLTMVGIPAPTDHSHRAKRGRQVCLIRTGTIQTAFTRGASQTSATRTTRRSARAPRRRLGFYFSRVKPVYTSERGGTTNEPAPCPCKWHAT